MMKAVVVNAPMDYGLKEVEKPQCPKAGLVIRVHACGLCGSDLRTLRNGHRNVTLPWIIGHEVSGRVCEVGPEYEGEYCEGDMLAVAPLVYCGKCEFCQRQHYELCENYRELAQAWPGGFAEYMALPAEALRLGTICLSPDGLDPAVAAIAEPISSCINAQEKGQVSKSDTVVVLGTGPIGCIHIALAKAKGVKCVIGADVNEDRLAFARLFEADHVVNTSEVNIVEEVRRLTDGKGAEVIITANPIPETQVQAVEMAKKGGRVLLFGGLPKEQSKPGIDTNIIHYNALQIIGTTTMAPRHHRRALELLAEGKLDGEKLVSHRFELSQFEKGVELAFAGKVLKAVFLA